MYEKSVDWQSWNALRLCRPVSGLHYTPDQNQITVLLQAQAICDSGAAICAKQFQFCIHIGYKKRVVERNDELAALELQRRLHIFIQIFRVNTGRALGLKGSYFVIERKRSRSISKSVRCNSAPPTDGCSRQVRCSGLQQHSIEKPPANQFTELITGDQCFELIKFGSQRWLKLTARSSPYWSAIAASCCDSSR